MATFQETAAHSVDICSLCIMSVVILVISHFGFERRIWVLIAQSSWSFLTCCFCTTAELSKLLVLLLSNFTSYGTVTVYEKPNEPRCEKTGLRGFRPGLTQTRLHSHRIKLEA